MVPRAVGTPWPTLNGWTSVTAASSCCSHAPPSSLVERVDTTGFIQIEAPSFSALEPRQQQLAYWLTQASIAIDPIIYDQLSQYGLREKRLLEGIMGHSDGLPEAEVSKIRDY